MKWTVTLSDRKDSDSNDSRKTFILCFDMFCRFFFFSSFSLSVVVVNFIGTMKSN